MLALFCCHFVLNFQGRNFGVKSGGTNSEGVRGAFGSWGEREGMESKCPLLIRLWGLRERRELS